jgi:glycosyltransferase involved in cell wall biosynthesis
MVADEAAVQIGSSADMAEMALTSPPRVSIGMPVFNGIRYIERAMNSLLAQNFRDFELIILDNASTDGTYELALTLARNPRVRVDRNDRNIGWLGNFVKVLNLARGEYFMWAAVDDLWEPDFVPRLVAELDNHPEAGVVMSATRRLRHAGDIKDIVRFSGTENPAHMSPLRLALELGSARKWSFFIYGLFRRPLLQQAARHFPDGGAPDRILLTQIALHTGFRYVDEILYQRQLHQTSHEQRYPDGAYSRNVALGLIGDFHFLWSLCVSLLASPVVPLRRKFYVPLICARFGAVRIQSRFSSKELRRRSSKRIHRWSRSSRQRWAKRLRRRRKAALRQAEKSARRLKRLWRRANNWLSGDRRDRPNG